MEFALNCGSPLNGSQSARRISTASQGVSERMSNLVDKGSDLSIVYLLTNPAMPGLVKIGHTMQAQARTRLDQLYSTGVPVPFELVFACRVPNSAEVERALHTAFAPQRVNPKREFFRIEPDQAIAILKLLHVEETTAVIDRQPTTLDPQDIAAGEELRRRRPNLDFVEMGIPIGSTLQAADGDVSVQVVEPKKVRLGEEVMSLTAATRLVRALDYSVAPSPHWIYNGRPLNDLYNETYN